MKDRQQKDQTQLKPWIFKYLGCRTWQHPNPTANEKWLVTPHQPFVLYSGDFLHFLLPFPIAVAVPCPSFHSPCISIPSISPSSSLWRPPFLIPLPLSFLPPLQSPGTFLAPCILASYPSQLFCSWPFPTVPFFLFLQLMVWWGQWSQRKLSKVLICLVFTKNLNKLKYHKSETAVTPKIITTKISSNGKKHATSITCE